MNKKTYDYKLKAIKAAKELFYNESIILQLQSATTEIEIEKIMSQARRNANKLVNKIPMC